ncbi:TetR/AcrR family transcriptional regulator [Aldersonia sp. NBC_00410]|uniref:TetR/AcrR family transcriptional regulator n=1 Tax=Aldersonia sp. NBC_00410 TaxID=2975954 RepID=UPI00224D8AD2|nr:TetR/AcrR family transcriptional regulator [Aldersonia sp. NBC_00410]MCX5044864.1 TetR/AcrR family transcriptional regulator [Aldersonia sp. NBC_00410]
MSSPSRGRPRDAHVHRAILDATRALLIQHGYAGVTMDRVAVGAGVGKQTVYRRWPSKAPMVAEAVLDAYGPGESFPLPNTGDIAADLRTWLVEHGEFFAEPAGAALVRALVATAIANPDDKTLYALLASPQREGLVQRLTAAADDGEIRADTDINAIAEALIGMLLYSVLAQTAFADMISRFDGFVDALVAGIIPPDGYLAGT